MRRAHSAMKIGAQAPARWRTVRRRLAGAPDGDDTYHGAGHHSANDRDDADKLIESAGGDDHGRYAEVGSSRHGRYMITARRRPGARACGYPSTRIA
jgi:hypothetical protein